MSELLMNKIAAVRARHQALGIGTGICAALCVFCVCLGLEMLVDWWLDLPWWMRASWLVVNLGLVGAAVVRYAVIPISRSPDDDAIALRIEEAHPQFATRLIAAIQLSRAKPLLAGASPMLVRATVRQAEAIAKDIEFSPVIYSDRFVKALSAAVAALLMLMAGMFGAWHDRVSGDLLSRAFLSHVPVPRKTRIELPKTEFKIARGDDVDLVAKASGVIPKSGWLDISFASGRRQGFTLERSGAPATFHCLLQNVQDSFEYRIHLGDNTTSWFHVSVLTPPMVTQLRVTQQYPPYTGRPNVERQLGDLSILQGSKLLMDIAANNEIAGGRVHWINPQGASDVPLVVDAHNKKHLAVAAPVPVRTTGFAIHLRDVNELENKDPAVYRIDLMPDKPPTIHITYPQRKEELVTREAKMEMAFDASDDFGIVELALKYKVDDGPEQSIPLQIQQSGQPLPTHLHNRYDWNIAQLSAGPSTRPTLQGSMVEYWLEAVDNNNVTGPGRGSSEHFSARIVSDAEKMAEILARITAQFQDMQQATEQQEQSHQDLGTLLHEQKMPAK